VPPTGQIADVMTRLEATRVAKGQLIPIFISIDPKRDTVDVVKEYVKGVSFDERELTPEKQIARETFLDKNKLAVVVPRL
jgi:cytochrome oxidase Cu insertion factor (SCO1/SenC/PrrC family)